MVFQIGVFWLKEICYCNGDSGGSGRVASRSTMAMGSGAGWDGWRKGHEMSENKRMCVVIVRT
jgi:hypothetical protein